MDFSAIRLDSEGSTALYEQLGESLAEAVSRGELLPGERLPSERDLAHRLGVSRTTVVAAYKELEARGLVRGYVGRGTFILAGPETSGAPFAWRGKVATGAQRTVDSALRTLVGPPADPDHISFAAGVVALDQFPLDLFRELLDRAVRRQTIAALGLGPTEGIPAFRRAVATRHGVRPEQVMAIAGAQQGIDLIARCLIDPGDAVLVDRPGYLGAIQTFRAAGANVVGWGWPGAAEPAEELEDLILRYRPKFLYTNPTFQNPTGRVMPVALRRDLLTLAARYRLPVVEDEPYRDVYFATPPPPSLQRLDTRGLVIYLGTFSKTLAPGLRLGWLVAAEAIVEQLAIVKQRGDIFSAGLPQLVAAELLNSRRYDEHLTSLRGEHIRRHAAMLAALQRHLPAGSLSCRPATGGLYLWCRLGHGLDARGLLRDAVTAGVSFVDGEAFYPDGDGRHELRLCFTAAPVRQIDEGVRRLAGLVAASDSARRRATTGLHPII